MKRIRTYNYWSIGVSIVVLITLLGVFASAAAAQTMVVKDDFSSGDLSGGTDGIGSWNGNWDDTGTVGVVSGALEFDGTVTAAAAEREVDLGTYLGATVRFTITGVGTNDFYFRMYDEDTTEVFTKNLNNDGDGNKSYNVPANGLTDDFKIEFYLASGATATVSIDDVEIRTFIPTLTITADPAGISEQGGTATVTVTRWPETHCATGPVYITLTITDDDPPEWTAADILDITTVAPSGTAPGSNTATATLNATQCAATFTIEGREDATVTAHVLRTLEASGTYGLDNYYPVNTEVVVLASEAAENMDGLGAHTYPTYLFISMYDWLHNFHDGNYNATRGPNQRDPDTDNFNKVVVLDSNLFPIHTSLAGDYEFPNITSRNTATWQTTGAPSQYSPSVNDYFNRSVAVAPNFIPSYNIPYQVYQDGVTARDTDDLKMPGVVQYGGRNFLQWAFVTDPGNHNIRRYEFKKLGDFVGFDADSDVGGPIEAAPPGHYGKTNCTANPDDCVEDHWMWADLVSFLCNHPTKTSYPALCAEYQSKKVLSFGKHNTAFENIDDRTELQDPTENYSINDPKVDPDTFPYVEFIIPLSDEPTLPAGYSLPPIYIYGNKRDAATRLIVGINSRRGDPPGGGNVPASQLREFDFNVVSNSAGAYDVETADFSSLVNSASWDYDGDSSNGIQLRLRIYSLKGGFILDRVTLGERDSAFAVKQVEGSGEARWNDLTSFLELVPPKSFPGYPIYTSGFNGTVGYGFQTNTSFDTAANVRFKNPRDVDVYRDMFDTDNEGPVYVFVADTMNSRIQVFMNATGSAGATNAAAPIRPVRVKGPTDRTNAAQLPDSDLTAFGSNELGQRTYLNFTGPSIGFGEGRKSDWRQFFVNYTSGGESFINITTGKGEFFYPHGVAVDQDPDTKDVYLFVADTFNHRIQVFRDTTGVSFQSITSKRFDFKLEKGWGTYPYYTSTDTGRPGAYAFKYPKGLDVARFSNNSSYLYVVDSKNYRLLKYLITEKGPAEFGGISSIKIAAGYGYDGTTFARNLTTMSGVPISNHRSFQQNGLAGVGFLNPQDVSTGYSGFYTYSGPSAGEAYNHEIDRSTGKPRGVRYLNNYMVYVTDYARNTTTLNIQRVNMRVTQFIDNYNTIDGVYLPWQTENETFRTPMSGDDENLSLGQGTYGPGVHDGIYNSSARGGSTGSTENTENNNRFSDRPVGIAALNWNTIDPLDMRVVDATTGNTQYYPNGAPIPKATRLRVGALSRAFFGLPYSTPATYTNFNAAALELDGSRIRRVHAFCYNTAGIYQGHYEMTSPPYEFTPTTDISANCNGYLKIIAEDQYFGHSGKTGTMIFKLQ